MSVDPLPRGEETRAALISAALAAFGEKGFDAVSTREIALAAKANSAMIAYHFGGKEGLRAACAEHVAERLRALLGAAVATPPATPEAARAALGSLLSAFIRGVVANEAARPLARFLLREISDPSAAFAVIYDTAFAPLHARASAFWAQATGGEAESVETRLSVFAMVGQALYFRIAREAVLKRMGWREIGPAEAAEIEAVVLGHLDAALRRRA